MHAHIQYLRRYHRDIKRWFSNPCYTGYWSTSVQSHQRKSTTHPVHSYHIITFLCNITGSIASDSVPFQAYAMLANRKLQFKDTPRLQLLLHKVTLYCSSEQTKGHFLGEKYSPLNWLRLHVLLQGSWKTCSQDKTKIITFNEHSPTSLKPSFTSIHSPLSDSSTFLGKRCFTLSTLQS